MQPNGGYYYSSNNYQYPAASYPHAAPPPFYPFPAQFFAPPTPFPTAPLYFGPPQFGFPPGPSFGYPAPFQQFQTDSVPPPTWTSSATRIQSSSAPTSQRSPNASQQRFEPTSPPCSDQVEDLARLVSRRMSTDEYGTVLREMGTMTVDKLKMSLRKLNEAFASHLKYSGLKSELYQRLRDEIHRIWQTDRAKFPVAKQIISQVSRGLPYVAPAPTYTAPSCTASGSTNTAGAYGSAYGSSASTGYTGAVPSAYASGTRPTTNAPAASSSSSTAPGFSRYTGATTNGHYGSASLGNAAHLGGGGAAGAAINRWQNDDVPIKFRPSPFYRVEKSLSPPVTLVKADQGDRKVGVISFGLTEAQRTLITKAKESAANPQYEVRLYCTSDNNYSIGRPHASQFPAPIEFPQVSEIKLNNVTVPVNTKGIKKQPGTTPPVNLSAKRGPTAAIGPGQLNRVELIYTNTERVTYYMVAYLVETTSVKKVVEKVKAGRTKPKEEVIQSIKDINSDEEIAAGPLGLSLRDPLSFARIGVPIRSKLCNHISCFDAETWFEMNEQTPTWGCPICSKTLKFEDMVVDGYFEDILKVCSSSVDSVTVNPDGTWRSDDNKQGTGPPRADKASGATNNSSTRNSSPPRDGQARAESTKPDISNGNDENAKGKGKSQPEALTLDSDSDDNDEPLAKRPRVGGFGGGGASHSGSPFVSGAGSNGFRNGRGASEVLDLTLSDSDDDQPAPAPAARPPPPSVNASSTAHSTAATTNGSAGPSAAGPPRLGGGVKSIADVQRDIDAMQERMRQEYGADWRTRFNP